MDSQTVYSYSRFSFELIEAFKRESLNPNNPLSFNPIVKPKISQPPRISKNYKVFFQNIMNFNNVKIQFLF